jgi:dihydroorotase-like cyclic amidohydrolase
MSNQSEYLLLKNGTVLIHGENDSVEAIETDVLVSGSKIAKLAPDIDPPQGSQVMYA